MENTSIRSHSNQLNNLENLEIWKDIPGFEGMYQCSSQGNIRSLDRIIHSANKWNSYSKLEESRVLKPISNRSGYQQVVLYRDGAGNRSTVHRWVALTFIPNPENKRNVNHIDGCKTNNKVSNLEWNTTSENILHAFRTGLNVSSKGEKHGMSKLVAGQVHRIRTLHEIGCRPSDIANIFSVSFATITHIVKRKTWKHI